MDADFIRHVRRKTGMTQDDLAERLGVDQGTVSRWERNQMSPRPRILEKLRNLLLHEDERRIRERSLALVRHNLAAATILDADLKLVQASEPAFRHTRLRHNVDLRRQFGTSMQQFTDRLGVPDLMSYLRESGLLTNDALMFRFVLNVRGMGHSTLYEPILEEGRVVGLLNQVTHYFAFPENDEVTIELVQTLPTGQPDRMCTLFKGRRAHLIDIPGG